MSRNPTLPSVAFGWYYLGRQAQQGRKIFANQVELDRVRALLLATFAQSGVRIHFIDARPRAIHLGVHGGQGSISDATGIFCQLCSREINRGRGEAGPLFRAHGVARLVQPGERFIGLGRCIHCAADLEEKCNDEVGHASDTNSFPIEEQHLHWTTKAVYVNGGRMSAVDASVIRRIAARGSRDRDIQHRASVMAFSQYPTEKEIELFRRGSPEDPRFIGSADFISAMCQQLGIKARPRANHYPRGDSEMHRIAARLVEAFRQMSHEPFPAALEKKWKDRATIENLCSETRKFPVPMLRGLAASRMRSSGIPQGLVEDFLHCKPRTLAAARRLHYQIKFKTLFGRPYEDLFVKRGVLGTSEGQHPLGHPLSGHQ